MIQKFSRNPNVWIIDTAATCDMTFRKSGITYTETPKESSVVVLYSWKNDEPELIGSITTNACDENKNTEFRLNMNELSYTLNYHFNLFIIGK